MPDAAIQRCIALGAASMANWISSQPQSARIPATEYQPAGPVMRPGRGMPCGLVRFSEGLLATHPCEVGQLSQAELVTAALGSGHGER